METRKIIPLAVEGRFSFEEGREEFRIPDISIVDTLTTVSAEQTCRTCVHAFDRNWKLSASEVNTIIREEGAEALEQSGCTPDEPVLFRKLHADGTITDTGDTQINTDLYTPREAPVTGFIDSCGWDSQTKCERCVHFIPQRESVEYDADSGTGKRNRSVHVAGYCDIPPEGITVGTRTQVTCDFTPRVSALSPSCLNCKYQINTGFSNMVDEFSREIAHVDIDVFDMDMARKEGAAMAELEGPQAVGRAIQEARHRILSHPTGVWRYYVAHITEVITRTQHVLRKGVLSIEEMPYSYKVRFGGSGYPGNLLASGGWIDDEGVHDNDLVMIEPIGDEGKAAVRIQLPYQEQFGYSTDEEMRIRQFPPLVDRAKEWCEWCEGPFKPCKEHKEQTVFAPSLPLRPERIDPDCHDCDPFRQRACFFHAKGPERPDGIEMEFATPSLPGDDGSTSAPDRHLMLHGDEEFGYYIGDRAGDKTSPEVLHSQVENLLAQVKTPEQERVVRQAHKAALAKVPYGPSRSYEVGYPYPSDLEPFQAYCALALPRVFTRFDHETQTLVRKHIQMKGSAARPSHSGVDDPGLDFREVMGDRFGLMAGEQWEMKSRREILLNRAPGFTQRRAPWKERMAYDEWIRGRNPEERYTEQLLRSEALIIPGVEKKPWVEPEEWKVTRLDSFGAPVDDDLIGAEYEEFKAADREERHAWLNHIVEYRIDEVVLHVPRMWLKHGFANFKGGRQRASGDPVEVLSFNHNERSADERADRSYVGYECVRCGLEISPEKVEGFTHDASDRMRHGELCPKCTAPLRWVETSDEDRVSVDISKLTTVTKQRRGIGIAVAPDSDRHQSQTRLLGLLCDYWTMERSSLFRPVTLKTIRW